MFPSAIFITICSENTKQVCPVIWGIFIVNQNVFNLFNWPLTWLKVAVLHFTNRELKQGEWFASGNPVIHWDDEHKAEQIWGFERRLCFSCCFCFSLPSLCLGDCGGLWWLVLEAVTAVYYLSGGHGWNFNTVAFRHFLWNLTLYVTIAMFDASSIFATISSVSESSLYMLFCMLHRKYGRSFSERTALSECTALRDRLVKCFSTPIHWSKAREALLSAICPGSNCATNFDFPYIIWGTLGLCWHCSQRDWSWSWSKRTVKRPTLLMGLWKSIRTCKVYYSVVSVVGTFLVAKEEKMGCASPQVACDLFISWKQ